MWRTENSEQSALQDGTRAKRNTSRAHVLCDIYLYFSLVQIDDLYYIIYIYTLYFFNQKTYIVRENICLAIKNSNKPLQNIWPFNFDKIPAETSS